MKIALLALLIALAVVTGLTPLARALGRRWGEASADRPEGSAGLSGAAICAGFLAAMGALWLGVPAAAELLRAMPSRTLGILLGAVLVCAVGAGGDHGVLRTGHRLLLQVGVAVFAYACGLRIGAVHVPLLGDLDTTAVALPLTVLWIAGVMNALALMDGLGGLVAGVAFFAAATNVAVGLLAGETLVVLLSAALAGAVLGSLVHALRPIRPAPADFVTMGTSPPNPVDATPSQAPSGGFVGSSGSYFLGYVLATTALGASQKASTAVSLLAPMLALGVPIFDTLFAVARRILERRSVFSPDRGHIHHRLVDMGLTQRRVVLIVYAFCAVFTVVAIGISYDRAWNVGAALFAATAALVGLVRFVGYFDHLVRTPLLRARALSPGTERLRRALPRLPLRFAETFTEDQLWDELGRFAEDADLGFAEVRARGRDGGERVIAHYPVTMEASSPTPGDATIRAPGGELPVSYPLGDGAARAAVRFGFRSGASAAPGEVPPEAEILLQIAADLLAKHLGRMHSALARAPEEPADASEGPDLLDIPARPSRV